MRLLSRLRRPRARPVPAYDDDGSLPVLVVADDAARADSDVLREAAAGGLDLDRPLLVRHFLLLPGTPELDRARELLAQDGYTVVLADPGPPLRARASRTQVLTAMSAAQERSRMAGLAQRLGGDVGGWDACGEDPAGHPPRG